MVGRAKWLLGDHLGDDQKSSTSLPFLVCQDRNTWQSSERPVN